MKKMFVDSQLQAQYDEKGYIVVDFFNQDETAKMRKYLTDNHSGEQGHGIFVSVHSWPADLNLAFTEEVISLTTPKVQAILPEWKVEGACYIVKPPYKAEQNTEFTLHQDYNMVDESDVPSLGLWIALVDTDQSNGGLYALPGSHEKFAGTLRGANMPSFTIPLDRQLKPLLEYITVKAGQACIFAHSLFHGSPPNASNTFRPIIHAGLFAPDSKPYHYLREIDDNGKAYIDVLEIDRAYYYQQVVEFIKAPRLCPHKVVGRLDTYRPVPTREEMLLAYGVVPEDISLIEKEAEPIYQAPRVGILPPRLKALKNKLFGAIKRVLFAK